MMSGLQRWSNASCAEAVRLCCLCWGGWVLLAHRAAHAWQQCFKLLCLVHRPCWMYTQLTMVGIAEAIHADDTGTSTTAAWPAASAARWLPAAVLCLRRGRDQRLEAAGQVVVRGEHQEFDQALLRGGCGSRWGGPYMFSAGNSAETAGYSKQTDFIML